MQSSESCRGTGRTTQQMLQAPDKAVYIWCHHDLRYPKALAKKIHREDLEIVPIDWLESGRWRGRELSGICIDHAAALSSNQIDYLEYAMARVRKVHTHDATNQNSG